MSPNVTTGSLVAELGLLEHHVIGVLRGGLDVNYPRGLISVNRRGLHSVHGVNSDTQVVDPGVAQVLPIYSQRLVSPADSPLKESKTSAKTLRKLSIDMQTNTRPSLLIMMMAPTSSTIEA